MKNLCFLYTKSFENGLEILEPQLKHQIPEVVNSIKSDLRNRRLRDDYKKFLELALIFLWKEDHLTLKKPGACHHARWKKFQIKTL